jgi:predicted nucleic acid-binding protein
LSSYADTSFVVALYIPDNNTAAAVAELGASASRPIVTAFTIFEFTNAVAARRFRGDISLEEMKRVLAGFREDISSGAYEQKGLPDEVWVHATALSELHTPRLGARALDVLHVASATALGATIFYTFDDRQGRLARPVGLTVRPRQTKH